MARKIRTLGVKMVLTGEGSDEMFGGYLYFHKAPNPKEFHQELVRKMKDLYKYDLLRADKSMLSFGVEARVPFLDKHFMEYVLGIDAKHKMVNAENQGIEKSILRKAFDPKYTDCDAYLPEDILWRQKE